MKLNMYAVYDEKAESYNAPFPLVADGLAIRSFEEACNNPQTDLYKYPGDFKLYCIGTWDDHEGVFESAVPPKYLCTNVKKVKENEISKEIDKLEEALKETK